jgi:hypothetical protein
MLNRSRKKRNLFEVKSLGIIISTTILLSGLSGMILSPSQAQGEHGRASAYTPWWDYSWSYRKPVTIDNTQNPDALTDYPVFINVSVQDLVSSGKMKSDRGDVRFTDSDGTTELSCWLDSNYSIWVKIPSLPARATKTIYLYYGNPSASSVSNGWKVFDFFDDFENGTIDSTRWTPIDGTWSIIRDGASNVLKGAGDGPTIKTRRTILMRLPGDATIKNFIADMDMRVEDSTSLANFIYRAQSTPFTSCDRWWVRLDPRSSTTTIGALLLRSVSGTETDMGCVVPLTLNSLNSYNHYTVKVSETTHRMDVRGLGGGERTYSEVNAAGYLGFQIEYTAMYIDNIRLRKCAQTEPTTSLGSEDVPFKFKSIIHSPQSMSDKDPVFFNATFNNPTPETIKIQLAAQDSDAFNATADCFYQEDVSLAPSTDTTFPFTWTAVGGPHTIWLAIYGYPLTSVKLKVNRDPVIAPVKDQVLWQDKEFVLQLNASDPDGDPLSWSIDNPMFNLSEVSNRSAEMSVLPTNDDVGVHRANVTVRDPMNRSDTRRINFTVNNVDDPPVLAKIPSLSATEYSELRYQAKADDPDLKWGDVLTFSDNTDLFEIEAATGVFSFTPTEEQVGKQNVKVTVTDKEGASDTASFTITVANVNDPPTLDFLPPQFALQGRLFQLKIVAGDPDLKSDPTEKLRFSDDSAIFNINNDTGLISFTPTNDQLGIWIANITVTDKGGLSSTTSLTITVTNANDPPSIESIPPQTATEGVPFQYQTNASDPDLKWGLDNLTFSDDSDLFNIDPKTGAIAFTPTAAQAGIKRVTITVKDEKGASASASFDLTIIHVNHAPYDVAIKYPPDGAKLKEGDAMWLDGTAKDSDKGDTLKYSWLDNDNPVGTGKNLSVELKPGKHTIKLEVSDGTETVGSEINVDVAKKGANAVSGGGDQGLIVGAAVALAAILAVVGLLAILRRRKPPAPKPGAAKKKIKSSAKG